MAFAAEGDWPHARLRCEQLLAEEPGNAEAIHLMAAVCSGEGGHAEAAAYFKRALEIQPRRATWWRDLGIVFAAANQWADAVDAFAQGVALDPADAASLGLHARALFESGRYEAASSAYGRWRDAQPESAEPLFGWGRCLGALGDLSQAAETVQRGLEIAPDSVSGRRLLAEVYRRCRRDEAELAERLEVVRLSPGDATALAQCADAYFRLGLAGEAISILRQAMVVPGACSEIHSALLIALLHSGDCPADLLAAEHRKWANRYAPTTTAVTFANSRQSARKLRIGYLSGERADSPGFYFLTPFFRHHDRSRFDVKLYSTDGSINGSAIESLFPPGDVRDVSGCPELSMAEDIRREQVDILVDVSGHYAGSTMLVAAQRAAPVQVSFPNYPAGTGVPAMDYILTDRWTCPRAGEHAYTEQPAYVPTGFLVYDPPPNAPPVSPLPASRTGAITFGLFHRAPKLHRGVWDAVAAVMRRVADAELVVHYASIDLDTEGSATRSRIEGALESRGVSARRLRFGGARSVERRLSLLSEVDIALDSFPYTGQTTTCECLWMGVPVVTLDGESHVSKVSGGILRRVGLDDCVASCVEEYVEIAVRMAGDLRGLAARREGLRTQVASSPLTDGARITRELEDVYRWMWRRWCESSPRG